MKHVLIIFIALQCQTFLYAQVTNDSEANLLPEGSINEGIHGTYLLNNNGAQRRIRLGVSNDGYSNAELVLENNNSSAGNIYFKTANSPGGAVERLRISQNGDIFLNQLNIVKNYQQDIEGHWLYVGKDNERQMGMLLTNDTKTKAEIKLYEGNTNNPYISFSTSPAAASGMIERMRIDKNGNITMNQLNVVQNYQPSIEGHWLYTGKDNERQMGMLLTNDNRTKAEIKLYEGNTNNPYISFSTSPSGTSNMIERMRIDKNGNLGIGCVSPNHMLDVAGTIRATEVKVNLEGCDFVFEDDYELRTLKEVEKFIKEHKRLPEIESAEEMEANGTYLGELNSKLLQKIEELTLYTIEQQKQIEELKNQNIEILELLAAKK